MGMYVSELRSVPVGRFDYYLYLVDASAASAHSKEIDRFFDGFAKQAEVDAVIVRGPSDLSNELFEFLRTHAQADFGRLEGLFHEVTCLVISEGALQTTSKPVHVLPLILRSARSAEEAQLIDVLLPPLLSAMRAHNLAQFLHSLGAQELELAEIKGGMLVATLRRLNDVLELKPNVAGLGLNVNAVIQQVLGPSQRRLRE